MTAGECNKHCRLRPAETIKDRLTNRKHPNGAKIVGKPLKNYVTHFMHNVHFGQLNVDLNVLIRYKFIKMQNNILEWVLKNVHSLQCGSDHKILIRSEVLRCTGVVQVRLRVYMETHCVHNDPSHVNSAMQPKEIIFDAPLKCSSNIMFHINICKKGNLTMCVHNLKDLFDRIPESLI